MSIAARMASYDLLRSTNTLDAYGIMSATPSKVTTIEVSITKNQPTHDIANPLYALTKYIGITNYVGVLEGDILQDGVSGIKYQVKDIGNKGTKYIPLFIDKI